MVKSLNKEINDKIDAIIQYLKSSKDYQKYIALQAQMDNNEKIMSLIREIRELQKALVKQSDSNKQTKLQEKIDCLNDIPLYREYNNTLSNINGVLYMIENDLNKYFYNKLN